MNNNKLKELSTTSLAKELNKSTQIIFQKLADMRLIVRNGESWDLTQAGKAKGGIYKESDKYGRYIVWPEFILNELDSDQEYEGHFLTATAIGKHFNIAANRVNSILSELGWIKRDVVKGWQITNLGTKIGGLQSRDKKSGVPYVRWPGAIQNNKILITNINEYRGDIPTTIQEPSTNAAPDSISFRGKFPPTHRTQDGHCVRSKSELIIDNWLYVSKIVHAYERKIPVEEELYCDFYIPTGKVYIELWGLDDEKYIARKEKKLEIYRKNGLNLIQLVEKDVSNLDDILPAKLLKFDVAIE